MQLTSDAAWAYLSTTLQTYSVGALSQTLLIYRMKFVRDCSVPGNVEHDLASSYLNEAEVIDDDWTEDVATPHPVDRGQVSIETFFDDRPPLIQFIAPPQSGLQSWAFHQADHDFHPSVPHGHDIKNHKRKLDAYLGFTYLGPKQLPLREPRTKIVTLWNDEAFRSFARAAIHFYVTTYPSHTWRVAQPALLPRKRRK